MKWIVALYCKMNLQEVFIIWNLHIHTNTRLHEQHFLSAALPAFLRELEIPLYVMFTVLLIVHQKEITQIKPTVIMCNTEINSSDLMFDQRKDGYGTCAAFVLRMMNILFIKLSERTALGLSTSIINPVKRSHFTFKHVIVHQVNNSWETFTYS